MEINVFDNYDNIPFNYQKVVNDVQNYFPLEKEVSLILVDLAEIQKINHEFRHLDYPTDVISFESGEDDYLGDIFICIDKALEQALTYGHSVEREFAFLLVHGLLHLQGYDHLSEEDEKIMFNKQEEILNAINYRRVNK